MVSVLEITDFQNSARCSSLLYSSTESFLKTNLTIRAGEVCGVVSDFGCGSWGLVTCLGGRGQENPSGKILLDGRIASNEELQKHAGFLGEARFSEIKPPFTVREGIERALECSQLPYGAEEIKKIFCLSDARFDRPIENVSGEIWQISAAIHFAAGKDIFCYPWLNALDIVRFQTAVELGTIDFLRKNQKIVLVPSSQKKILKSLCDRVLIYDRGKTTLTVRRWGRRKSGECSHRWHKDLSDQKYPDDIRRFRR